MALRTMVDPNDPQDVKQARALQDAVIIKQRVPGRFEIPNRDQVTQKNVRDMLLGLNATLPDLKRAFGSGTAVDHVRRLIGTARVGGECTGCHESQRHPSSNDGASGVQVTIRGRCRLTPSGPSRVVAQRYVLEKPYDA